jgi:hypothetical protein
MNTNWVALAEEFASKPVTASRVFRELWDGAQPEFLDEALRALCTLPNSFGADQLLRHAAGDPHTLARIVDPSGLALDDAIRLVARMQAVDACTDVRLLQVVLDAPDSPGAARILEIVPAVSDYTHLRTLLPKLLRHTDARVRSKAVLLMGRLNQNCGWLEQRLTDIDPRVRANAVEAMWGASSSGTFDLFLAAARDGHFRVAANGIVGLHRAGVLGSARIARVMSTLSDPCFRAAAAWAMGECQDPRFLPVLGQMLVEIEPSVRRNALRATVRIRKKIADLRMQCALQITAELNEGTLEVRVRSSAGSLMLALRPTAFVVEGAEIDSVQQLGKAYQIAVSGPQPQPMRVCVYAACGMGEQIAC